jgi:hypothetical protein
VQSGRIVISENYPGTIFLGAATPEKPGKGFAPTNLGLIADCGNKPDESHWKKNAKMSYAG